MKKQLFDLYCRIQRAFNLNWLPPLIHWEFTFRCNQRCTFCPYYGTGAKKPNFKKELSAKQIDRILANITRTYKFYKPHFGLTGGDILVRRDIQEILESFKRHKLSYSVTTNGLGLTEELAAVLKSSGCQELRFSLHGLPDVNDKITRIKNSFKKTMDAINLAKCYSLPVLVNCVITNENVNQLSELLDTFNILKIPIRFQHLEWLTEKEQIFQEQFSKKFFGEHLPMKFGTTQFTKIEELFWTLYEYNPEQEPRKLNEFTLLKYYGSQTPFKHNCISIFGTARIDPSGMVYPCVDYRFGDLKERTFRDIWNGAEAKHFRRTIKRSLMPGCPRCCKL